MVKQIRLNAFDMNCVAHQSPGLWAHPRDRSWRYRQLDYWTDLAKLLERGRFDGLFLADVLGVYDVFQGSADAAIRQAAQVPVNDPLPLVSAMAYVTEHLGFGVTCSLSYEHPYPFARRMSTLDHLTGGRIGWNIVTSYLDSAARNVGLPAQADHDERYALAEEYLQVCYKLWEGSWEDDAVVRDAARQVFTEPSKVHPIAHRGRYFDVPGIHLCEPSPQRTPVLYQAGASNRGKDFAAQQPSRSILKAFVADIRTRVKRFGRDPNDVLIFNLHTVITGASEAEARAKHADYRRYASDEGALVLMSGWTGIDLSKYDLDEPLRHVESNAVQSAVEALSSADPTRTWTVREISKWGGIGGLGPLTVGDPAQVADELQSWVEETDVDGFNLAYALTHETFSDFVELVVPELQRRGVYKTEYAPGTLREKLHARGARLSAPHPGAGYRATHAEAAV